MKKAIINVSVHLLHKIKPCLKEAGYHATAIDDQSDGLTLLSHGVYDLAVVEFPPDQEHIGCIEKMRAVSNAAILVLVASEDYRDIRPFLECADDALLLQFDEREFTVRATALAKYPRAPWRDEHREDNSVQLGEFRAFPAKCIISHNRTPVKLTPTEFAILNLLASHPGQVFTQGQIYNAINNDYDDVNVDKVISNHISRLRKKLHRISKVEHIKLERAMGYHFDTD